MNTRSYKSENCDDCSSLAREIASARIGVDRSVRSVVYRLNGQNYYLEKFRKILNNNKYKIFRNFFMILTV